MRFWKKSLMVRLVAYFLFLSLATVGLVGSIAYIRARETLKQSIFARLEAVATLKESELKHWMDDLRQNVVFVAWAPLVRAQVPALFEEQESSVQYQTAFAALNEYLRFVATTMSSDLQEI